MLTLVTELIEKCFSYTFGMDNVRILGHSAVRAALRDTETYSSDLQGDADVRNYRQIPLEVDPPRHHLYRSALAPIFVRPKIQSLEPNFAQLAQKILGDFSKNGGGDFIGEVALKYVIGCLGEIYDRQQDVAEWLSWGPDVWTADKHGRSGEKLHSYLDRVYEEVQNTDTSDVWNFVANLEIGGQKIGYEEFKGIAGVLLAGGRDTVVKLLTGCAWHFVRNPQDGKAILSGEASLENAIQEILRVFTPLPAMLRVTEDQKHLSDTERDPAKFIAVDFASANYDSEVFENPEQIDIYRKRIPHLSFGFGPHTCIGSHIAETEAKVLLGQILPIIETWHFDHEPEIAWQEVGTTNFPERFLTMQISVN